MRHKTKFLTAYMVIKDPIAFLVRITGILVWITIIWLIKSSLLHQLVDILLYFSSCNGLVAISHHWEWPSPLVITVISWLKKCKGGFKKAWCKMCLKRRYLNIFTEPSLMHSQNEEGDTLVLSEVIIVSIQHSALLLGSNVAFQPLDK